MGKNKNRNHKKSGGKKKGKGGGKFDLKATLTDPKVYMGSAIGLGLGVAIELFGAAFITNKHARNAIKVIVPPIAAGFLLKDKTATIAAGAAGLAMGAASYAVDAVSSMVPAQQNVKGAIGENIYDQVNGDTVQLVQLPDGTYAQFVPQSQVSGMDGFEDVSGSDGFEDVSGDGSVDGDERYNDSLNGELEEII